MLDCLNFLREFTILSVLLRILFSVIFGGLIGLEREYKRRPAGFRTHILICLGACMTTMTSQFLSFVLNYNVDLSRLGAQVVTGIGFIGAGTIIVTRQRRVKELTTAAGLWTCAILGLTIGAAFWEGAAVFSSLILLAECLFGKLEYRMLQSVRENILYVEYAGSECMEQILEHFREKNIRVDSMEITRRQDGDIPIINAIFCVHSIQRNMVITLRESLFTISGVLSVEEL